MSLRLHSLALLTLMVLLLGGCAQKGGGSGASSAQSLVDSAERTARVHLDDGRNPAVNMLAAKAKGALILPGVSDLSFFFSLGGGNAVLLAKTDDGWTGPVFLAKSSGGLGFQAGVSETSGVVFFTGEADVRYLLETGATLQGQAAVTFLDTNLEGNRTPQFYESGETYFIGERSGVYAGMAFNVGGFSDRKNLNAAYHKVEDGSPQPILYDTRSTPAGATALRELFEKLTDLGERELAKTQDDS